MISICNNFLNSLPRCLTFSTYSNFLFPMYIIYISYFVVYSVKMVDTSDYTVEYRVRAASFFIKSDQTRHTTKLVRDRLHMEYDIESPNRCAIKAWSNKSQENGSLFDRPRSGRPTEREMRLMMVNFKC